MTEITLQSVTKSWGALTALKPIDLHIPHGEFLVLLGPSGCGKTTTMRIIAGLETASSGTVLKDGADITNRLPRERNMAMVFQNYALYPHMKVLDNVAYPLRARGMAKAEREKTALAALEKVGLAPYANRLPKNLSGGQRQRVALARALVRSPDVFLMDEPLSNLDAKLRGAMRAEIKHIQRETGITTIYVTHDQIEAMTLADRVIIMEAGEIRQIGTPDQIYDDPDNLFVAGFLGSPPMNFIPGDIQGGAFRSGKASIAAAGIADAKEAQLGIRAEDITVATEGEAGDLTVTVYSVEPTGDATLVVADHGKGRLVLKADKHFRPEIGATVNLRLSPNGIRYFDSASGARLRTSQ
ncbi:ABC transporter ATP-binding protein [Shinella sp. SUS2]|uniref:ABC transporter ATP-binding protein n=1 Tax=unclassified Shinella TaxID=2643062 RepID=UPI0006832E5F|nr:MULTISPECIES: ABC transporter ATP-binding protein [unclassified Shinella]KNY15195.1 ABC transporter ATP-binding protein [Shinella sp. SUS2]KOC73081.1 ABC transporter ATP-binding protein [Shinella sp. GWS1]MCA0342310.1 ABC transporter ATP-binding protein [Pseudomonadota bacterium]